MRRISARVGLGRGASPANRSSKRLAQGPLVADGCELGMADDLSLEAVRQDLVDVMGNDVAGDRADAVFRLQDVAGRSILLLDGEQVFGSMRSANRSSNSVSNSCLVRRRGVGSAAFVENLHRRPVVHRVHHPVGVDVFAEALHRPLAIVAFGDQRRAGEGDAGGVGERLEQIVAHVGALRAMRLVHHDQDALGRVYDAERLRARRRLIAAQLFARGRRASRLARSRNLWTITMFTSEAASRASRTARGFDYVDLPADQLRRPGELLLQVGAVD